MTRSERNKLWIGIGIGAAAGIGGGYLIGRKRSEKRHREEMKKARKKAYMHGLDDGLEESKKFIDTYCVVPEEGDTPEMIQEKLEKKQKELAQMAAGGADIPEEEAAAESETAAEVPESEPAPVEEAADYISQPARIGTATVDTENHQVIFTGSGGTKIAYPAGLFIGPDGEVLDSIDIRTNIRKHEHNLARLNLIWSQMGWGAYIPELDGKPEEPEEDDSQDEAVDIDDWDLSLVGDEPEEKVMERERYLDLADKYIAKPEEAPAIISRKDFNEDAYLDKINVDFYDVDKVFVESTDEDHELDAYEYFGVTDGNDLFKMKDQSNEDDDDPDIVYVRNFRMNCVMEVTRWHKSYGSIRDGSGYIRDGGTD